MTTTRTTRGWSPHRHAGCVSPVVVVLVVHRDRRPRRHRHRRRDGGPPRPVRKPRWVPTASCVVALRERRHGGVSPRRRCTNMDSPRGARATTAPERTSRRACCACRRPRSLLALQQTIPRETTTRLVEARGCRRVKGQEVRRGEWDGLHGPFLRTNAPTTTTWNSTVRIPSVRPSVRPSTRWSSSRKISGCFFSPPFFVFHPSARFLCACNDRDRFACVDRARARVGPHV